MGVRTLAAITALAIVPGLALGQWAEWDYDFDTEKKPWKEIEAKIPAAPSAKDLVRLHTGTDEHRIYIDANSVSRGEDGVMRYTVVMKTSGGATNVSFEGMRCDSREQKTYALGRSDGSWARARDPQWKRIVLRDIAPYHYVLFREYFCVSKVRPLTAKQAVEALKQGRSVLHGEEGRQHP